MNDTSRRKLLAVAGAGAAAGAIGLTTGSPAAATTRPGAMREPVVAFIEQPWSSVVVLMVGDREVEVRDRDLVSRILAAAGDS